MLLIENRISIFEKYSIQLLSLVIYLSLQLGCALTCGCAYFSHIRLFKIPFRYKINLGSFAGLPCLSQNWVNFGPKLLLAFTVQSHYLGLGQ